MTKKTGFTLAEVLITLVIIGVVAALTIPALIQSTNQTELRTAFKKSISVLGQTIALSVAQSSVDAGTCNDCESNATGLAQFFISGLNVLTSNLTAVTPYFYTTDGIKYTVHKNTGKCGTTSTLNPDNAECVLLVDINGDKSPNTESTGNTTASFAFRDQYRIIISASSALPASNTTNTVALQALQQ